ARNTSHTANLIIHMENHDPPVELPLQVLIHIPALPPRVVFDPPGSTPLVLSTSRRGQVFKRIVIPRNTADEALIPLTAQITSDDTGASGEPMHFHHNEPITLTVDTATRPHGSSYDVTFHISYHLTSGA